MLDEKAKAFYRRALEQEGPAACGFSLAASQRVRFDLVLNRLLNEEWNPSNEEFDPYSLLDVGCGTGDLLFFLEDYAAVPSRYVGLDLMPEMVEHCRERMSTTGDMHKLNAEFMVEDVRNNGLVDQFDYSVAVATFCLKPEQDDQAWCLAMLQDTLRAMGRLTRKAMLVTVLSTWKTEIIPEEFVVDPTYLWSWAKVNLGERVDLIHSYAPHDFALIVDFRKSAWRQAWETEKPTRRTLDGG